MMQYLIWGVIVYLIVINLVTFIVFGDYTADALIKNADIRKKIVNTIDILERRMLYYI